MDLSTLYSSIANDFKRKKSTAKVSKCGSNDNNECQDELAKVTGLSHEKDEKSATSHYTLDPESLFAKAIMEGDVAGVRKYLETVRSAETIATMQLKPQNVDSIDNGKRQ